MHEDAYIGTMKRDIICTIDILLIPLLLSVLGFSSESTLGTVFGLILILLYFILTEHYWGATLAQKLFKLKVVDSHTGNKPSIKQLVLRELSFLTVLTGIGAVIANFTHAYYSGFYWDRWSRTKVIPAKMTLGEFNKYLNEDREKLFPSKA